MDERTQQVLFHQSLTAFRSGRGELAARGFRALLKGGSQNPRHVSYCGLAVATVEGKTKDGRLLCKLALRNALDDPEMHLNLALVHEREGARTRAIQTLLEGLAKDPRDMRLLRAYGRLNRRGAPVIRFLVRDHSLNRFLGHLRSRVRSGWQLDEAVTRMR